MAVRYVAWWASGFDDRTEEFTYGQREFKTLEAAKKCAMREGRKAGDCPWTKVEEQVAVRRSDQFGAFNRWDCVKRWTGDWDGLDEVGC